MKIYDAIKLTLKIIEDNPDNKVCIEYLAQETGISQIHLQRVFMAAFKISLAKYIRLRKLSVSLNRLAFSNYKIIDIANEFGFEHEQSYIRAFKREFHMTPGQFRNNGAIIKTLSPFTMADFIYTSEDAVLSMPDIVVIPEMYLIGDLNFITRKEALEKAPRVGRNFWENNRFKIKNAVNKDVYIGLTRMLSERRDESSYLSAMQVSNIKNVPDGLFADKLPPAEYLRFSYIGNHHYYDLNDTVLDELYHAVDRYLQDNTKYHIEIMTYFERIDTSRYDGTHCYLDWVTPVALKS